MTSYQSIDGITIISKIEPTCDYYWEEDENDVESDESAVDEDMPPLEEYTPPDSYVLPASYWHNNSQFIFDDMETGSISHKQDAQESIQNSDSNSNQLVIKDHKFWFNTNHGLAIPFIDYSKYGIPSIASYEPTEYIKLGIQLEEQHSKIYSQMIQYLNNTDNEVIVKAKLNCYYGHTDTKFIANYNFIDSTTNKTKKVGNKNKKKLATNWNINDIVKYFTVVLQPTNKKLMDKTNKIKYKNKEYKKSCKQITNYKCNNFQNNKREKRFKKY